jgi:hypothetical protein
MTLLSHPRHHMVWYPGYNVGHADVQVERTLLLKADGPPGTPTEAATVSTGLRHREMHGIVVSPTASNTPSLSHEH